MTDLAVHDETLVSSGDDGDGGRIDITALGSADFPEDPLARQLAESAQRAGWGDWVSPEEWRSLAADLRPTPYSFDLSDKVSHDVDDDGVVVEITTKSGKPAGRLELSRELYEEISDFATARWVEEAIKYLLGRDT